MILTKRRIIASVVFLIGDAVTWYVFSLLHALGAMESGMSAGPIPRAPAGEAFIPWFACAYFVISAVGVLVAKKRTGLRLTAALAHLMLLVAFCLICSGPRDENFSNFFSQALTVAFTMAVFFSPWIFIWLWILSGFKERVQEHPPAP